MSAQIRIERKQYYEILEKTQKGDLDITEWIVWFLNCLINALKSTDSVLTRVLFKAEFWKKHIETTINDRQRKLLNKLMDGFDGKLTSSKWAKIAVYLQYSDAIEIKKVESTGGDIPLNSSFPKDFLKVPFF